jgi:Na+-transporting NADH:ubiquinone oxidoreductase subunit C
VAVPFAGDGLWGPIRGFLALEADRRTIRGIAFHEQEETPGLGGEIAGEAFRAQFRGKRIVAADGTPGIVIRRGKGAQAVNEVDGITGATMTCEKVQAMLNRLIARIAKE